MHNQIINTLQLNGLQAYIVGGAVRDSLLGEEAKDIDIATNASPAILIELFSNRKTDLVGKSFGVIVVDGIEVATFRKDCYSGYELTECIPASTVEEDLARRDLTINSMAIDPDTNEVIDPFGGVDDLKNRIIRFTGIAQDRINEDPCRILRACRFFAKINGDFDIHTGIALYQNRELIKQVAPERIRTEILKAMEIDVASNFFIALDRIRVLSLILPSLEKCLLLEGGQHHGEDVFVHNMIAGDSIHVKFPLLKLAGYVHDIGKVVTAKYDEDGEITFHGHEKEGLPVLEKELRDLKFSNDEITYISNLVRFHMRSLRDISPKALRRLIADFRANGVDYRDYLRLKIADRRANLKKIPFTISEIKNMINLFRNELSSSEPVAFSVKDLAINGDDVMRIMGIKPGKTVGIILNNIFEMVLESPEMNTREELIEYLLEERENENTTNWN